VPAPRITFRLADAARSHRDPLIPSTHTVYREIGEVRLWPVPGTSWPLKNVSTNVILPQAFENTRLKPGTAHQSHIHGKRGCATSLELAGLMSGSLETGKEQGNRRVWPRFRRNLHVWAPDTRVIAGVYGRLPCSKNNRESATIHQGSVVLQQGIHARTRETTSLPARHRNLGNESSSGPSSCSSPPPGGTKVRRVTACPLFPTLVCS
jgi:hypothetical protein